MYYKSEERFIFESDVSADDLLKGLVEWKLKGQEENETKAKERVKRLLMREVSKEANKLQDKMAQRPRFLRWGANGN